MARKKTKTEKALDAAEAAFSSAYDGQAKLFLVTLKAELVDIGRPLGAIDRAWAASETDKFLEQETIKIATEGLVIGGFTQTFAMSAETRAKMLRETYGGMKPSLLKTLRAETTKEVVKNEIRTQITANGNVMRVASKINKAGYTRGTPTKLLDELARAVRLARQPGAKEVVQAANRLKKHAEKLAKNGAPTEFLKKSYLNLADKALKGSIPAMEKALERAIGASAKYNAQRIARTELAATYAQAEREAIMDDPDVGGSRFLLDARHQIVDECDFYAEQDLYGLGPGIYPKNEGPLLPIHPNGMSTYVPISTLDISNPNAEMRDNAQALAANHPAAKRIDLEGHIGKWVKIYKPEEATT
jgi:hypothetical protein